MGRYKGMGRKGEKQSRNIISGLHLKHRSKYNNVLKPRVCACMSRGLHCKQEMVIETSMVLHRLPCIPTDAGWQFVPSRVQGTPMPSNPFSPEVHARLEHGWWKTGKEQGEGQRWRRTKERKATCLKKWNSYLLVEWRYDNLNFLTFFLV